MEYGVGLRENVAWKGEEPTDLVRHSLNKGLIEPGQSVADIGCGWGRNSNWLASRGFRVTGININDEELKAATQSAKLKHLNTTFIEGDARQLPIANSSCDVAIDSGCSHILPTEEDQLKAAKEQARILKPGGILLYFGFTTDHPAASGNPASPMYRNIDDLRRIYGDDFIIIESNDIEWKPDPGEHANFALHKGINVTMRRK